MIFLLTLVVCLWLTFRLWKPYWKRQVLFLLLLLSTLAALCALFVWGRLDKNATFSSFTHPHLRPQEYDGHLRVYQQVIRTGSDAVEAMSFHVDLHYQPLRIVQHGPPTLLEEHMKKYPRDYDPMWVRGFAEGVNDDSINVIKGYLCKRDVDLIRKMSNRPVKVYTMLRDPVERILSFYNFLIHSGDPKEAFNITGTRHRIGRSRINSFRGKMVTTYILSNVWNGATHQYGDVQHVEYREMSDSEVLESAKRHLESMDKVEFFENMGEAYWSIAEEFKHPSASLFSRLVTRWGSHWVTAPRLQVRKWRKEWNRKYGEEFIRYLETNVVPLDIELYKWAQVRFEGPPLFDSYWEYAWGMLDEYLAAVCVSMAVMNGWWSMACVVSGLCNSVLGGR